MRNKILRIFGYLLLAWPTSLSAVCNAASRRAIPDDNLAYPVLITLKNGSTGSGFYLDADKAVFLVTAKQVIFDPKTNTLNDTSLSLLSYPKEIDSSERNFLELELSILNRAVDIKSHPSEDVVLIKVATVVEVQSPKPNAVGETPAPSPSATRTQILLLPGVIGKQLSATGLVGVSLENVETFDHVLVGNEILMFGYPTSLSLVPNPKIYFQRSLLRKGIVAGENPPMHSIILDRPSYQGDSGGPILQIELDSPFETHFKSIGVMSSFAPFADTWMNQHFGYINTTLQNSGYSIATPIDFVLDLIK